MAIQELMRVVAPPTQLKVSGSRGAWQAIQNKLGIALPDDYRDFGMCYGAGFFDDPDRVIVRIPNPFDPTYHDWVSWACETLTLKATGYQPDEWPYKIFPEPHGLFPLGKALLCRTFIRCTGPGHAIEYQQPRQGRMRKCSLSLLGRLKK